MCITVCVLYDSIVCDDTMLMRMVFYFSGGPGGFTEYILSKHAYVDSARITGFGMSLAIPAAADRSYTSLNWSLDHLQCPPVIAISGHICHLHCNCR